MPKSKKENKNKELNNSSKLQCQGKCQKIKAKNGNNFYKSNNPAHQNKYYGGYTPICKGCLRSMCLNKDNKTVNMDGLLKVLELLDKPYIQEEYIKVLNKGKGVFDLGEYSKDITFCYPKYRYKDSDMFQKKEINNDKTKKINQINKDKIKQLQLFWGNGFTYDEYMFLENELEGWKATHKYNDRADLILLKEICLQILTVRIKRESKEDTSKALKDLQDLMKTASVDPAKSNSNDLNKSGEALGVWIKDIEQYRPGEWYDQQEKYKDMDGFIAYIKNYIIRPIKNFIAGSRDFKILTEKNIDDKDSDKK